MGAEHDDRDAAIEEILLEWEFLIGCDQDLEACVFGRCEQGAVIEAGETGVGRS